MCVFLVMEKELQKREREADTIWESGLFLNLMSFLILHQMFLHPQGLGNVNMQA